eukprot:gene11977-13974_t
MQEANIDGHSHQQSTCDCQYGYKDGLQPGCDSGILGIGIGNSKCGDNICNELPESCLQDCYDYIGTKCSSQIEPTKNDIPLTDTLSHLLNNQYQYTVPGLSHLSHGVDLLTYEEVPTQIFDTGYCNNVTYSTLQDIYRYRVYNVPPEFYAESSPQCTYDSESRVFKSYDSYRSQLVQESTMDVSAGVSVNFGKIGGSADFAMSKSSSVDTAKKMEKDQSSNTVSTTVKCISTSVTRNAIRFHENFVKDISDIDTPLAMSYFIERYGAMFYESASLGGSLEMLVSVHSTSECEKNEETIKKQSEISAGGSFTTPYGGAGAKYSGSDDSEISSEQQRKFEQSVSKSSVFVKGGALGSFGPDMNAPSSFGEWAKSLDLRPVPINPKLNYVGNVIPSSWTITKSKETNPCTNYTTCLSSQVMEHQLSVQDLWRQGFNIYLDRQKLEAPKQNNWFIIHFVFKIDPPSNRADQVALTNLTLTFNMAHNPLAINDLAPIVVQRVTIPIGCSVNSGASCQYHISLDQDAFTHQPFELQNMTIKRYDPLTSSTVFLDASKYFDNILVESTNPDPTPIIDPSLVIANQSLLDALNVNEPTQNITFIRELVPPDVLPVMYPNVGSTRLLFTAIDTKIASGSGDHKFFAVRVGELGYSLNQMHHW